MKYIFLLIALVLLLAACGNSDSKPNPSGTAKWDNAKWDNAKWEK
jgi:major membrane immunogen (membrane-anchored lipoprotein)